MSAIAFLKENWRIITLVVFVSAALVALFIPGGIIAQQELPAEEGERAEQGLTNIEYGLGLDGGTRVAAPVVGMHVDGLQADPEQQGEIQSTLYDELELETADAIVRFDEDSRTLSAEVFDDSVTPAEFAAALQAAGLDVDEGDVSEGVTAETRDEIVETIQIKINEAGLSGGQVTQRLSGDTWFIVVEVPDMSPEELRALLQERGVVEIVGHYPDEDGEQVNETLLTRDDLTNIGSASYNEERGYHYVPVTVTDVDDRAFEYQERLNELGFTTGEGLQNCDIRDRETGTVDYDRGQPNYCLKTVVDGEVVDAHSMGSTLGANMHDGEWAASPSFEMITPTQQDAFALAVNLQAGELRAPLDFERDQTFMISPALADQFKEFSLLIAVLSVLTVSGMVYLRYRDVRVAAPMVLTALAEVVILLGLAAAIRMPLDLSHIAGFIAVIGTGVDDLIIIADEVMSEGDVSQRRIFDSRFRKAFWVIGAAAATTIVALSPLAVLSLGDLRGFAIITILGVLIGVLVTRPAYGDILRYLLTDR